MRAKNSTDHHSIAGGPQLGTHDLTQDGHVVAVEKAPAQTEDDQADDRDAERARIAHAEQRRQKHRHTNRTRENPPA